MEERRKWKKVATRPFLGKELGQSGKINSFFFKGFLDSFGY